MRNSSTVSPLVRRGGEVNGETATAAWSRTFALAENHDLTVYGAAYLELALRKGLPLASAIAGCHCRFCPDKNSGSRAASDPDFCQNHRPSRATSF